MTSLTAASASDGACVNGLCTFGVGRNPAGLAFDGANMWVANESDNSVTKLRASDGLNLGTFPVRGAIQPNGVVYDGADIWVTGYGNNTLVKLLAANGTVLGTFPAGNGPQGIAFDGANIWVSNFFTNTVSKF